MIVKLSWEEEGNTYILVHLTRQHMLLGYQHMLLGYLMTPFLK